MTLAALVLPLILWTGPPPDCERLGREIVTWAATVETAAQKAQAKAAKRGATHLYVTYAVDWPCRGRARVEAAVYLCQAPERDKE